MAKSSKVLAYTAGGRLQRRPRAVQFKVQCLCGVMSRRKVFLLIALPLLIIVGGSYWFLASFGFVPTTKDDLLSDAEMRQRFLVHEVEFSRLVNLFNEDAQFFIIAADIARLKDNSSLSHPEPKLGFSQERWDEYRQLFKQAGLKYGISRGEHGSVNFDISCEGWALDSVCKGIAYLPEKPPAQTLRDSLDAKQFKFDDTHRFHYENLKGNWYIYVMT